MSNNIHPLIFRVDDQILPQIIEQVVLAKKDF